MKFYFCSCQIGKPRNCRAYVFPRNCVPVTKSCLGAQSKWKYMFCLVGSVNIYKGPFLSSKRKLFVHVGLLYQSLQNYTTGSSSHKMSYIPNEGMRIQGYCENISSIFQGSVLITQVLCRLIHTDSEEEFSISNGCHGDKPFHGLISQH